jgi:hypothetical protein
MTRAAANSIIEIQIQNQRASSGVSDEKDKLQ